MKSAPEKSPATTTPAAQAQEKPFFNKAGGGDFFKPSEDKAPKVQAKMTVNKPGDKFEQEADKMADKVMRMPAPAPAPMKEEKVQKAEAKEEKVQKMAAKEEKVQKAEMKEDKVQKAEAKEDKIQKAEAKEEKIQKAEMKEDKVQKAEAKEEKVQKAEKKEEQVQKAEKKEEQVQKKEEDKIQRNSGDAGGAVSSSAQGAIQSRAGGGQALASEARNYMEPRFGADFGNVRVHNDSESARLNDQLGARAFTYQNNIFFGENQYQPGTGTGKQLLAHELTHTIQQGHAEVQRKPEASLASTRPEQEKPDVQKAPAATQGGGNVSSEVVVIASNTFSPSPTVDKEIEARGSEGLDVRIKVNGLTEEGRIKVRKDSKKTYDGLKRGSMPLSNPWLNKLGGSYVNFKLSNSQILEGYASFKAGGGDKNDWLQSLKKNAAALGGVGLKVGELPTPENQFDNGKLKLGVSGLDAEVGGFLKAKFNLSLENIANPIIDASGEVDVKGMAKGELKLDNKNGGLAGEVSLGVNFPSFNGTGKVKYNANGTIDISGKAGYSGTRLSGEIEFVATDLESANKFTKDAIAAAGGKENIQSAGPPAPPPVPKEGSKKRALAAAGSLSFNLTKWFAGKVSVVVDGKGQVTAIGKIAPPAEIQLFPQKDWDKELVKFEAKAYYGIPLVGNLNLFANISLRALAKLGPAKIYNIEILGTYSTDPEVQQNIQISGSINISAYAGLRLRAEGGAGIELVGHDLKFGVGLNADIGVKAYADARPTVGFREPGEFYISGTLEMVAQPMLGLGGDFFIELDSPWWSPAPDKKWTWPLFSKEWPLTDPIGLSATVKDYVLGSGKVPEIEMKKPEFDPSKFMTNMVDDNLPSKSGKGGDGKGAFKEDGSVPKPEVKPKKAEPKKGEGKAGGKGSKPGGGKSGKPDTKAAGDQDANKLLKTNLDALKNKAPFSKEELTKELDAIKSKIKGITLPFKEVGGKWVVTPGGGGKKKSAGQMELGMKKGGKGSVAEAFAAVASVIDQAKMKALNQQELSAQIAPLKAKYPFKKLEVITKGAEIEVDAEINPVKIWKYAGKIKMKIIYDPTWPLDEFMSKAKAIQSAATIGKLMTLPIDPITDKQLKTKHLRKGEQDAMREKIRVFIITKVKNKTEQNRLLDMLQLLQADHQQELQMMGEDKPGNLALIEGAMNQELGWHNFRPALRKLPPSTVISSVIIDTSAFQKKKDQKKKVRPTGDASAFKAELLKYAVGGQIAMVNRWFKLD